MKYFRTLWLAAMAAMCIFSTNAQIKVGAESTDEYIPLGRRQACGGRHAGKRRERHDNFLAGAWISWKCRCRGACEKQCRP